MLPSELPNRGYFILKTCQKVIPINLAVMVALPGSAKLLSLADILTSQRITDVKQMMTLTKGVARLLRSLHKDELMVTGLDVANVKIKNWGQVRVYFLEGGANIIQLNVNQ